jgi:hypothetical protein
MFRIYLEEIVMKKYYNIALKFPIRIKVVIIITLARS